jgi:hypothetical protein
MNNWMARIFAIAMLAASLLVTPSARAQLQGGAGTMSGANAEDFDDLVAQDVAKGYYTAEQGEQLKAQWDQSMQNLTDSLQKAQTAVQRTDSLAQGGNQMTLNQLSSLANAQGQTTLGGTPEEIQEQSKAIYNAAHLQLEVGQAQIENIAPVLQTAINEISTVANARNALIQSNPNVSAAVKHNAGRESAQVEDLTKNALQSGIGKFTEQMQQAQATLDNNKQQIINQIQDAITTQSNAQGTDPTKWTKPTPPAKATLPPNAKITPNTPDTQTPPAGLPTSGTTYTPSNNGSVTGTTTKPTTGTVPSNQGDPALSASRNSNSGNSNNGQGNTTPSNTAGNTGAAKNPAANNGPPAKANNNANQPAQPPVRISQVLTQPNVPKPQTPPPPPKLNQQDLNNALNKKPNIPLLPIATPPANAPPNAPKDPTAIALLDKPNGPPKPNGNAVVKNAPPSQAGKPVLMPSSSQGLGLAPQTDQSGDNDNQPQNATPPPADQPAGTGSNAATTAGTAVANAAAAAAADIAGAASDSAADATNSAQMQTQGSQAKATIIPVSNNDPNAESTVDPSFNANRNNPNPDPATSISNSGNIANGSTSADPGGFIPPNQQAPQTDNSAAAQADAAAAAAAAGVADSSPATPAPPQTPAQSSNQQSIDAIQAQIASQLKAGNLGGHLVEGDEGVEGTASATPGGQMPAISNLDMSVELGDTLSVATLSSIYVDYSVTPGQNGSSVIVAGTTQVATPSSLMTAPSLQVSTPGAMMTTPSMQVQVPSSVMIDPSDQVQVPSDVLVIPSSQINIPSNLLTGLDLQVALCGR